MLPRNAFLSILLSSAACTSASAPPTVSPALPDAPAATVRDEPTAAPLEPVSEVPAGAKIIVRRRGGAGALFYKLEIDAGGAVSWEGVNQVALRGSATGNANPEAFAEIWLAFAKLGPEGAKHSTACTGAMDDSDAFDIEVHGGDEMLFFMGVAREECPDNATAEVVRKLHADIVEISDAKPWITG